MPAKAATAKRVRVTDESEPSTAAAETAEAEVSAGAKPAAAKRGAAATKPAAAKRGAAATKPAAGAKPTTATRAPGARTTKGSPATRPAKGSAAKSAKASAGPAAKAKAAKPAKAKGAAGGVKQPRPPKRTPQEIARAWADQLGQERPGLVEWTMDRLSEHFGKPVWQRLHDPTSELILTILSASNSDINAEYAFELLRAAYPSVPPQPTDDHTPQPRDGWGGKGIPKLPPPNWAAVEHAPLDQLIDVIRPGGLGPTKAPRLQASLAAIREETGDYSLEFLGRMPALEAREWMRKIPGVGPKTASVVLLFSFGSPLMPVDRHVERVCKRVGILAPKEDLVQSHDTFLELLAPERMYEGHVDLIRHGRAICHAQKPDCAHCPIAERCRYYHPDAP